MARKILLFGATGTIGKRILTEALHREDFVTAAARDISTIAPAERLHAVSIDILDTEAVAKAVPGHDAVISAFGPGLADPEPVVTAARSLTQALSGFPDVRLIAVGGAGSLEVAPGVELVDTPQFPADWKGIALAHRRAWEIYRNSRCNWTYAAPSALIQPGDRTGIFRLGTDQLLVDKEGTSSISVEDFAVAIMDEVEKSHFVRQRFTVGY